EPRIVVPVVVGSSPIVHPIHVMLIVISGPSGVGKGTIINQLLQDHNFLTLSVSATTRQPRPNETHGEDYYFFNHDEFDRLIQKYAFLDWCTVHTNRYGTLKDDVSKKLINARAVIIEIDVQGAKKIRQHGDFKQHHIFIAPPSLGILKKRLTARNTESEPIIAQRLAQAENELNEKDNYDTIIVNNELTQTHIELNNVILSLLTEGVTQ
ncbi:MAG: guanylate kinase, partial [Candidatus Margulisiibacteriota bacterium]